MLTVALPTFSTNEIILPLYSAESSSASASPAAVRRVQLLSILAASTVPDFSVPGTDQRSVSPSPLVRPKSLKMNFLSFSFVLV